MNITSCIWTRLRVQITTVGISRGDTAHNPVPHPIPAMALTAPPDTGIPVDTLNAQLVAVLTRESSIALVVLITGGLVS